MRLAIGASNGQFDARIIHQFSRVLVQVDLAWQFCIFWVVPFFLRINNLIVGNLIIKMLKKL